MSKTDTTVSSLAPLLFILSNYIFHIWSYIIGIICILPFDAAWVKFDIKSSSCGSCMSRAAAFSRTYPLMFFLSPFPSIWTLGISFFSLLSLSCETSGRRFNLGILGRSLMRFHFLFWSPSADSHSWFWKLFYSMSFASWCIFLLYYFIKYRFFESIIIL